MVSASKIRHNIQFLEHGTWNTRGCVVVTPLFIFSELAQMHKIAHLIPTATKPRRHTLPLLTADSRYFLRKITALVGISRTIFLYIKLKIVALNIK